MYVAARFGGQITYEQQRAILRWRLAEATGWTLDYIDSLSMGALWEWLSIRDADAKYRKQEAEAARLKAQAGRRKR